MLYRVTNRLRPVRIGMLAGLASTESFVRCVELCSALWGARYNPILPALESTEHWAESAVRGDSTPGDTLDRWMRNFDADIVAKMEDAAANLDVHLAPTLHVFFKPITDWRTVLGANNETDKYGIGYGVGLLEIARDYISDEATFIRNPVRRLVSPTIRGHAALSGALFGRLDNSIAARYHSILGKAGHENVNIDVDQALRFLRADIITPLTMSERLLHNDHLQGYDFYALNEEDPFDLALFWNIRASTPYLVPVTASMLTEDAVLNELQSMLADDERYEDSPRRVLVGSLERKQLKALLARLALLNPNINYLLRPSEEEYGPSDFTPDTYSTLQTKVSTADEGRLAIEVIVPDIHRVEWKTGFRFANDVTLWSLDERYLPADAIPRETTHTPVDGEPLRTFQTPWRTGNDGFVFLPFRDMRDFEFYPPRARDLVRSFFAHAGFACGFSEQGMLLEQLIERLGDQVASGLVTHRAMHEVYKKLDGRGTITSKLLLAALQRNLKADAALAVINVVTSNGVLAQGMIQQCPLCNQHPWFALDALADELRCEYCRGKFTAKLIARNKLEPALRILPPLDIAPNRNGLLAVLALLNFLRLGFSSERLTVGAGVKLEGHGVEQEYDLVVFARGIARSPRLHVMFCEASAYAPFDNADFQRFDALMPRFPMATFAFVTLREAVREDELRRIHSFAIKPAQDSGTPQHKVLVLTGNDLTPNGDSYRTQYHGANLSYFVNRRSEELLSNRR